MTIYRYVMTFANEYGVEKVCEVEGEYYLEALESAKKSVGEGWKLKKCELSETF